MKKLEDLLSKEESDFVRLVFSYPGSKLGSNSSFHWFDDGSEHGQSLSLWEKPESLGLIECVGSYKWKPTNKLSICIVD